MKQFEILDISGDAGIRAFGKDLQELFTNAASGMYSLITDVTAFKEEKTITVSAESHSLESLLVSWLNELVFYFDTYGFIGNKIEVAEFSIQTDKPADMQHCKMTAFLSGEDFDPERHERRLLIKAATYHKLRVDKTGDLWNADIIFDI